MATIDVNSFFRTFNQKLLLQYLSRRSAFISPLTAVVIAFPVIFVCHLLFCFLVPQLREPPLQSHLKNVYSCVALSTLAAGLGGFVHLFTGILTGGFLSSLVGLGFMIALMSTPDDGKNTKTRLGYLLTFAFLSGLGLGPLLEVVIAIEPAVIPTAFLATCLIFTCFSVASMLSNQRQYIYLGGSLMSLLSVMLVMSFLNIFMGSYLIFKAQLYIGLAVMCAFILYDTQMIMEKRRNGDKDYIWHSVCLFLDLIQVFRYLLILLTDKESNKKKK